MPARVRIARVLLLMWAALYLAHRLGFGDPFGLGFIDVLIATLHDR